MLRLFAFGDQDTIESVITFRIDDRTIKRGILGKFGYLSARCSLMHCI